MAETPKSWPPKRKSKRIVELEAQLARLRAELKAAKIELKCAEEERRRNACQQEANDTKKKRLTFTSMMKLDKTCNPIEELTGRDNDRAKKSADSMRIELSATLDRVKELANELSFSNESEARALEGVVKIRAMLDIVKRSEEGLRLENIRIAESRKSLLVELDSSRNRANSLQRFIDSQTKMEVNSLKNEVYQLKQATESAKKENEKRGRDVDEQANRESSKREAELEAKLRELTTKLLELQSKSILCDLQMQEARLRTVAAENEALKSQIAKMGMERSGSSVIGMSWQEAGRELDAARATGLEMESELRIVKVQLDQWRKAAEVAAAMLSTESVGVDRTVSFGCDGLGGRSRTLYCDEMDDYSSHGKRSGNVLKRIGLLLKKGSR